MNARKMYPVLGLFTGLVFALNGAGFLHIPYNLLIGMCFLFPLLHFLGKGYKALLHHKPARAFQMAVLALIMLNVLTSITGNHGQSWTLMPLVGFLFALSYLLRFAR